MAKNLIIYYSRVGENYWNGNVKNISKGNTEIVAEFIKKSVGGDLFQVETVKEYAADYYACIDDAKAELRQDDRPELKKYLEDISEYDNIVVAGPCWWSMCYNKDKSEETQCLQGVRDWFSPYYFAA